MFSHNYRSYKQKFLSSLLLQSYPYLATSFVYVAYLSVLVQPSIMRCSHGVDDPTFFLFSTTTNVDGLIKTLGALIVVQP